VSLLDEIEQFFGKPFMDQLWYSIQFRCSGITCCEIVKEFRDDRLPPDASRDRGNVCGDSEGVD